MPGRRQKPSDSSQLISEPPGTELPWSWGRALLAGVLALACPFGAAPEGLAVGAGSVGLAVGAGLPEGVGPPADLANGIGPPEDAGPAEDVGPADWLSLPEGDGLGEASGDPDPAVGLGETAGRIGPRGFAGEEDGAGEDGCGDSTAGGIGAEVGALVAPLEFGAAADAAGEAVGGVGPLVHGDVELVVDDVVWALAGAPEVTPL